MTVLTKTIGQYVNDRRLNIILKEFPWMWAVNDNWFPGHNNITICRASALHFVEPSPYLDSDEKDKKCPIWVKINSHGVESVRKSFIHPGVRLFEAVARVADGCSIQYVAKEVKRETNGLSKDFIIYRAPSRLTTINELIMEMIRHQRRVY